MLASPDKLVEYRPISVLPLFSIILEKLVMHRHLYPLFVNQTLSTSPSDQFALRPMGSTNGALNTLVHAITSMLATEPYVYLVALDFLKAFGVAHHSTLFHKLSYLSLPDHIYSWLLDLFSNRMHLPRFNFVSSTIMGINSSVVQGSSISPPQFTTKSQCLLTVCHTRECICQVCWWCHTCCPSIKLKHHTLSSCTSNNGLKLLEQPAN